MTVKDFELHRGRYDMQRVFDLMEGGASGLYYGDENRRLRIKDAPD